MSKADNYVNQPNKRNEDINFNRIQYKVAKDLIKNENLRSKKVLDYGSGNGEFSIILKKKGAEVECFEPNKDSQKALKKFNLNHISKLNKYDYIFLLDVIEHVIEPDKLLEKLKNHLTSDGKIIITTPDCNYWKYKIKHLLGDVSLFGYPHKHFVFFIDTNLLQLCKKYFHKIKLKRYPYTLGYLGRNK